VVSADETLQTESGLDESTRARGRGRGSGLAVSGLADRQRQDTGNADAPVGITVPAPNQRLTTIYEYDENTLQLIRSQTANSKIATSYQYNPDGQLTKVTDATGTREFAYDPRGQVIRESVTLTTGEKTPPITYEINRTYTKLGQPASVHLVSDSDNLSRAGETGGAKPGTLNLKLDHEVAYEWNDHGQLSKVKSLAGEFVYEYDETSPALLTKMTGPVHEVTTTYEPHRNLITGVTNRARDQELKTENSELKASPPISSYTYANDILGRRETISQGGEAFAMLKLGANTVDVAYNDRSEVIGAAYWSGEEIKQNFTYDYNGIGNRLEAKAEMGGRKSEVSYQANVLNQYASIRENSGSLVVHNPSHDLDGNLIEDVRNRYTWDSENRLIRVDAKDSSASVTYTYDYQSRRTSRTEIKQLGTTSQVLRTTYYIYDDWNVVAELEIGSALKTQNSKLKTYTWGRDLSGSLQGAGGVGGLLAITDGKDHRYPAFDANGNVGQLVDEEGNVSAAYAYDPFGNVTDMAGTDAPENQWRFSTKPYDEATGWLYYGFRYYQPDKGRWASRDPMEERGGTNIYEFARNNGVRNIDKLGLDVEILFGGDHFYSHMAIRIGSKVYSSGRYVGGDHSQLSSFGLKGPNVMIQRSASSYTAQLKSKKQGGRGFVLKMSAEDEQRLEQYFIDLMKEGEATPFGVKIGEYFGLGVGPGENCASIVIKGLRTSIGFRSYGMVPPSALTLPVGGPLGLQMPDRIEQLMLSCPWCYEEHNVYGERSVISTLLEIELISP
jgi:RHS repeat-associated protein